jgi:hypothetical protein
LLVVCEGLAVDGVVVAAAVPVPVPVVVRVWWVDLL